MPQPHFTLNITATAVAWYAAVLSTITTIVQTANYLRDRKRAKLKLHRHFAVSGDPRRAGKSYTIVKVANIGRRPITIDRAYFSRPDNSGGILIDTEPRLPAQLSEGQVLTVFADEHGLDFNKITYFAVCDSGDHQYRVNVARWYKRALWAISRQVNPKP